jgi:hypothetical protein
MLPQSRRYRKTLLSGRGGENESSVTGGDFHRKFLLDFVPAAGGAGKSM